jgi:hypothetical protein
MIKHYFDIQLKGKIKFVLLLSFTVLHNLVAQDGRYSIYIALEKMYTYTDDISFKLSSQFSTSTQVDETDYLALGANSGQNSPLMYNNYYQFTDNRVLYEKRSQSNNITTIAPNNAGIYSDYTHVPSLFLCFYGGVGGTCFKELPLNDGLPHYYDFPNGFDVSCPNNNYSFNGTFNFKGTLALVKQEKTVPVIISNTKIDSLNISQNEIILEAPEFMSNYFNSNEIVWVKKYSEEIIDIGTSLPIVMQKPSKGDTVGYGTQLKVIHDPSDTKFANPCGLRTYYAFVPKFNWLSGPITIRFSPNLRLGTELIVSPPLCDMSQAAGDLTKSNGKFTLNTPGRSFDFSIDAETRPLINSGDSEPLEPTGNHTLIFRERFADQSIGCPQTLTVAITPPKKLSYTQNTLKDINCFGEKASYGIKVQGGTLARDTLVLDNSTKLATDTGVVATLTNISKGAHTLVLKDAKGCVHENPISFTVTEPQQLQGTGSLVQPKCFGNDAQLSLSATGGTAGYTYSFNGQTQVGNTYTTKAGTTVTLGLSDSKGCTATVPSITVDSPKDFSFVLQSQKNNRCAGESKGEALTMASSTDLSYTYTYSSDNVNYLSNPSIKGLSSGTHTLYTKNNMGCMKQLTVNIAAPATISLTVTNNQPATCVGNKNGSIQVQVSGGAGSKTIWLDPKAPYKPANNAGAYSKDFTGLGSGNYKVYAQDDSLCQNTLDFSIGQQSNIYTSISKNKPSCSESTDGQISLSVSGGVAPYRYNWQDRPALVNLSSPKSLEKGTYIVQILDGLNCEKKDTVVLDAPAALHVQLEGYPVLCKGQSLELDAGNPGNNYDWSSSNGLQAHTQKITATEAGTYYVKVSNFFGCTGRDTIKISQSSRSFEPDFLMATHAVVDDTVTIIANNKDLNTLTLDWKAPSGSVRVLTTPSAAVQEYIFEQKGDYDIWLMAQDQECRAGIKKTIHIYPRSQKDSLNNALGIDAELFKKVELFPNPTSGQFTLKVELDVARSMEVSLHSLSSGALIQTVQLPSAEEQIHEFEQSLAEGLYVLYLKVGKETVSLRLFVAGDF